MDVTFCIVNTNGGDLLARCLDAVGRERATLRGGSEVLVLDNASDDGSAERARAHPACDEVIALHRRTGKATNDSTLLQRARGPYALLLNEDSELEPGATQALVAALDARPDAAAAGAALLSPDGVEQPSAWRFPGVRSAAAGAVFLHRHLTVQSGGGSATRDVDWAQSSALLVRRAAAAAVGYLDPAFFVYSDEVDFCRRLRDRGWAILHVPAARAIHHEQLSSGSVPERRIVEMARNRDLYVRRHDGRVAALVTRLLTAWAYGLRALAALALPGHDPRRYARHVAATLAPNRGEGLREAAEAFNAKRPR